MAANRRINPNDLISQETGFDGKRTAYVYDLNGQLTQYLSSHSL
ncbi:hypothetical protein [Pseudomonas xanthosomatis]|nr:hypothetical protein [Pseudomonas xanthosomatis]